MKNKCQLNVSLDKDLVDSLKKLAEKEERTVSLYVNKALKEFLNKHTTNDPPSAEEG